MLSNEEDGTYAVRSSVSLADCHLESNGLGGSGHGFTSAFCSMLSLASCVLAHHVNSASCGLSIQLGDKSEEKDEGAAQGSRQVASVGAHSSGDSGDSVLSSISSCQFIANTIGCHVILSPDAEAPPVIGCKFLKNKKIGDLIF
jgi:hypothetical protein